MKRSELIKKNEQKITKMVEEGAGYYDIAKAIGFDGTLSLMKGSLKKSGFICDCEYAREKVEVTNILKVDQSIEKSLTDHFGHDRFGEVWDEDDKEYVYVYKF